VAYILFTDVEVELTVSFLSGTLHFESSPLLPSLLICHCREKKQSTLYEALCRDIAMSALIAVQSGVLNIILQQVRLIWKLTHFTTLTSLPLSSLTLPHL